MTYKSIGTIGIFIPFLFAIGFIIFFKSSDPVYYENLNNVMSIVTYNIRDLSEFKWIVYVNYIGLGITIVIFCIALLIKIDKIASIKIGLTLLLISGLSWTSLGFAEINENSESMLFKGMATLITGAIGLIVLGAEFNRITKNSIFRWIILSCGILIVADRILDIILLFDYPQSINQISWVLYFIGFGVIGLAIYKKGHSTGD